MKNQRGQALVEIALITPLMLIALMIPIDFAIMYQTTQNLQNAVRETARLAATTQDYNDSDAEDIFTAQLAAYGVASNLVIMKNVSLLTSGAIDCSKTVEATATIRYPFTFYRMMGWFGVPIQPMDINRTARMRYEFQPVSNGGAPCS